MAIRMPWIIPAKLRRSFSSVNNIISTGIPKGYFVVYVGEQEKTRFVVPVSLLSQPMFQELLHQTEEEFGYNHPIGGLTIPCSEDIFSRKSLDTIIQSADSQFHVVKTSSLILLLVSVQYEFYTAVRLCNHS